MHWRGALSLILSLLSEQRPNEWRIIIAAVVYVADTLSVPIDKWKIYSSTHTHSLPSPPDFPPSSCYRTFRQFCLLLLSLQLSKSFGRVMCQLVFRRTRGERKSSETTGTGDRADGKGRTAQETRGANALFARLPSGEAFSCSLEDRKANARTDGEC